MTRQPQWSLHEAAVLLDVFLKVQSAILTQTEAICFVSNQLRAMAKNSGVVIDDTYRNANGITFQMASMESAYLGRTIMKPATRLFNKIVEIYRIDIDEYHRLLEEAQVMANRQKITKEEAHAVEVKARTDAVDSQHNEDKYQHVEITISERIRIALKKECERNRYGTTVTYLHNSLPNMQANDIREILTSAPWAKYEYGTWRYVEISETANEFDQPEHGESKISVVDADNEIDTPKTIDFNSIPALVYTRPVSFSYFGEKRDNLRSWTELYTAFFTILYEDYSHNLKIGMSFTAHNNGRTEFGDAEMAKTMKAPKPITTTNDKVLYIETNLSAHDIVGKIKFLLDLCSVDYEYMLIQYAESESTTQERPAPQRPLFDTAPFERVMAEKFVRGFRIGSPLDMKKFRRYYESANGKDTEFSDAEVEAALLACSVRHGDKVFAPAAMLPAEVRDKLFSYIRVCFQEGKRVVYYEALFRAFSDVFLDYYIYDAQMLKAYIAFYNGGEFHLESQYISKDTLTQADPLEEVKNYLITAGVPMESSEICEILSHIPQKKVMQILGTNAEFVNNGKRHYFHVDIVHLSEEEIENVANLIVEGIHNKSFLSGNELAEMIRSKYPFIIENNSSISTLGMRDTLKYHLKKRFSFKGNIISALDHALSMADVFGSYAKSRPEFTMDELTMLASEMNSTVYFDAVYDNSLRIGRDQFVAKDMAQFRIGETDRAIDRFFADSSYLAIEKVDGFGSFPDAGFPWNTYLLEYYVHAYSKRYRLLHAGFNQECCVGAIVKNESGIQTFDDLLAMALADSEISLKREQALEFLAKEGYLARRMYSNIENVLIQASTYRNRKGTK